MLFLLTKMGEALNKKSPTPGFAPEKIRLSKNVTSPIH